MNPIEFCRERSFSTAICLTYSFDPLFFERVVLRSLWEGGSNEVLVVADRDQLRVALDRNTGRILHLGRRYLLSVPVLSAAQHAKLIVRVGQNGALVWIGSNNLTAAGWGGEDGNRELATAWKVDVHDSAGIMDLRLLLQQLSDLLRGPAREIVKYQLTRTWLKPDAVSGNAGHSILMSAGSRSLASQLSDRWKGRTYRSLKILTGSTDENGAFIAWAVRTFGIKQALVGLDPKLSVFKPRQVEKIDIETLIIPLPSRPRPHAKFYWFEGPGEPAALVGSANCSAAAWLLPPDNGGNIESVLVYDGCRANDFNDALSLFDGNKPLPPSAIVGFGTVVENGDPHSASEGFHLIQLSLNLLLGQLSATIEPAAGEDAIVTIEFGGLRSPLVKADTRGTRWVGKVPDFPPHIGTRFGRLIIRKGRQEFYSTTRWLDEEEELQHASRGKHSADIVGRLGSPPSKPSELAALLREMATVSAVILDSRSFPDASFRQTTSTGDQEGESQPVNPNDLVKSMAEAFANENRKLSSGHEIGLPLLGVMRVLFPSTDQRFEVSDNNGESEYNGDANRRGPDDNDEQPPKPPKRQPLPEALKGKFVKQVEHFQEKYAAKSFAESCTATQLVQAVAYQLALSEMGRRGGWVNADTFTRWVTFAVDRLFRASVNDDSTLGPGGLLRKVASRYKKDGQEETFGQIIGDGTLWTALAVVLVKAEWKGPNGGLLRALAIREVLMERDLIVKADAHRLRALLTQSTDPELRRSLFKEARKLTSRINEIEELLAKNFDQFILRQMGDLHRKTDIIWNKGAGFGVSLEDSEIQEKLNFHVYLRLRGAERLVASALFVNVRLAAEESKRLNDLIQSLDDSGC
jgi:hypothetical protein